ncbi:MAG TPA: SRPBCC family protein [Caulobacteraceae bacterium]|nr:SRPBCC family protein [Caulobacteraceae bacterium]
MDADKQISSAAGKPGATVERTSERELLVTRTVNGPVRMVFEAWVKPDLFQRWWAPQSFGLTLVSYEADVRTGGAYRLVMGHPSAERPMTFFGRYIDVTAPSRLVWTNDEGGEDGPVTTVTFVDKDGATRVVVHELYPSKEALDAAMASGSTGGWGEQFEQLDELVVMRDSEV